MIDGDVIDPQISYTFRILFLAPIYLKKCLFLIFFLSSSSDIPLRLSGTVSETIFYFGVCENKYCSTVQTVAVLTEHFDPSKSVKLQAVKWLVPLYTLIYIFIWMDFKGLTS